MARSQPDSSTPLRFGRNDKVDCDPREGVPTNIKCTPKMRRATGIQAAVLVPASLSRNDVQERPELLAGDTLLESPGEFRKRRVLAVTGSD